jgi:RNA polymerase sigma-70 factor (ECF subfamily)
MESTGHAGDEQLTTLLLAWGNGDRAALDRLVPLVHRALRQQARRAMRAERQDHTLQPTALVNEVYVRLAGMPQIAWSDRTHFFALAARLMRRVLVDLARARRTEKRGGEFRRVTLDDALEIAADDRSLDLACLDEVMEALAAHDPRKAQVVELRFFGGLDIDETAEVLKVSRRTVLRDWNLARTWIFREMKRRGC